MRLDAEHLPVFERLDAQSPYRSPVGATATNGL
jgi:hypothetical protein